MDTRRLTSSDSHGPNVPYIHKVGIPPKQSLLKEFKSTVKETFFSDDPLRPFKDQPKSRKIVLGLQAVFPILEWGRSYNLRKFRGDLIAGLTIASLCIPQDIGYSKLANLPPQYGLCKHFLLDWFYSPNRSISNLFEFCVDSSFVPPLIYAFMGSSRDIAIGPVAVVSLLLGTLLRKEYDPDKEKSEYLRLVFTSTFFAGITQATLGVLRYPKNINFLLFDRKQTFLTIIFWSRLGFLIDFLSHAAVVGFMAGAAITIALQQLKGFLGIKHFTKETDIISVMKSVFGSVHHGWNWQTIVIGASFLTFLLVAKYIGKKNKKLFWVPAIAPLISVVLSTFFVYITHAKQDGVAIVGRIEKRINPPSLDKIYFSGENLLKGFRIGAVAGMIALTLVKQSFKNHIVFRYFIQDCSLIYQEAVAIGRTFASMKDYQVDGNKEMVALGTMNVIGSMTSCYVATGSFSRSAVNYMAGCQTAVSNIVMSFVVFLTVKFLTPLFEYTPNAILSSIIISAVIGLIDFDAAILIWKIDKLDFMACMGAFLGVVFKSVETGLLIAVALSLAKILLQVTRPRTAILGKIPMTTVYRNIGQYPEATKVPAVTDIDTSGIHAFEELHRSLQKREIQLVLANPGQGVLDKLYASGFPDLIGENKIFLTVADAVHTCSPKMVHEV
ncbi:STAS domain-containing protein [Cynara cardunculus var. scolymus]|uniref:STAS domain-containing protein n=1 Tax=Cynara cardunculus var. scolymus TaxID=59895 RepID=A0A103YDX8_CYNCS|nr:STAS domain-containing protein [Cynara cardunculus var. scolymus]